MSLTLGHRQALVLLILGFPLGLERSSEKLKRAWTGFKPWPFLISPASGHTAWRERLYLATSQFLRLSAPTVSRLS